MYRRGWWGVQGAKGVPARYQGLFGLSRSSEVCVLAAYLPERALHNNVFVCLQYVAVLQGQYPGSDWVATTSTAYIPRARRSRRKLLLCINQCLHAHTHIVATHMSSDYRDRRRRNAGKKNARSCAP